HRNSIASKRSDADAEMEHDARGCQSAFDDWPGTRAQLWSHDRGAIQEMDLQALRDTEIVMHRDTVAQLQRQLDARKARSNDGNAWTSDGARDLAQVEVERHRIGLWIDGKRIAGAGD